jgi:RimJ/RimL family protein N-acetyltransferase
MSLPMDITFTRVHDQGTDRAELVRFLTSHEWPHHTTRRPAPATVESWIDDGRFGDGDHAAFWIESESARLGLVVLEDLSDDAPLFDLRLDSAHRGKGLGFEVLRALTTYVFSSMPAVNRFEGQTRDDNTAMRKTFQRAGFVKEAHYRDGWPVENGVSRASVAYGILRRDWETGRTTPVEWTDLDDLSSAGDDLSPSRTDAQPRDGDGD